MTNGGELLQSFREKRGLSQAKLGRLTDFSASFISRIESGERGTTRKSVLRLAAGLRLDDERTNDLLHAFGYVSDTEGVPSSGIRSLLVTLSNAYLAAPAGKQTDTRVMLTFLTHFLEG